MFTLPVAESYSLLAAKSHTWVAKTRMRGGQVSDVRLMSSGKEEER
jgi:hypothetical protein